MSINTKQLYEEVQTYEELSKRVLDPHKSIAIRLDLRTSRKFLRHLHKPWDDLFVETMRKTAIELLEAIPGAVAVHTASDEITIVLYPKTETGEWNGGNIPYFNGRVEKIISLTAASASNIFNKHFFNATMMEENMTRQSILQEKLFKAQFDARVFQMTNNFQIDAAKVILSRIQTNKRNSVSVLARHHYQHDDIVGKSSGVMLEMIKEKGDDWHNHSIAKRYGSVFFKKKGTVERLDPETQEIVTSRRLLATEASEEQLIAFADHDNISTLTQTELMLNIDHRE